MGSAGVTERVENFAGRERGEADFVRSLFRALDTHRIRYCVLHSWQELPDKVSSDLDLAVHPRDMEKLALVFQALRSEGYRPVQCLNYFTSAYCFVFSWFDDSTLRALAVDIVFDHRGNGLILGSGGALVAARQRYRDFWVADPATEFTYLLSKKAWKGAVSAHQARRLKHLVDQLGQRRAEELAGEFLVGALKRQVVQACAQGSVNSLLTNVRKQLWWTSLSRHPLNLVRFLLGEGLRVIRRWLQPTGLFVAVLGPDGVGKSTLVGRLIQTLRPCFRRQALFHWRPEAIRLRPQTEGDQGSTNPHHQPARGTLKSIGALLVIFLDYWLGRELMIRPLLARSSLVLFDRYFPDLLVDPLRYRYGGPLWLLRFLSRLIPRPDITFLLLSADEEVIFCRKRELPPAELRRQLEGYQQLFGKLVNARLLRADENVEGVVAQASRVVVDELEQRFQRCHGRWLSYPQTGQRRSTVTTCL